MKHGESFIDNDRKKGKRESQTPDWALETSLLLIFSLIAILCALGLIKYIGNL